MLVLISFFYSVKCMMLFHRNSFIKTLKMPAFSSEFLFSNYQFKEGKIC